MYINSSIKITVAVIAYNAEEYIQRCITSIISQSIKDFELLVIDDGSTDNTKGIVESIGDYRVRCISGPNRGRSFSRNLAVAESTGDFISFVDADDYVRPSYLEDLSKLLIEFNCDITCAPDISNKKGKLESESFPKDLILNSSQFFEKYCDNSLMSVGISGRAKLIKKSLFDNISYPEGKDFEDEFVTPSLIQSATKIGVCKTPTYVYVERDDSIVKSTFSSSRVDYIEGYTGMIRLIQSNYPQLKDMAERKLDGAYLNTLGHAAASPRVPELQTFINELVAHVRNDSSKVIFSKNNSVREKVASFCLLFGFSFFRIVFGVAKKVI